MKYLFCLSLVILFSISLDAQAPKTFKYQAVLRDANGQIRANQNVALQLSIIEGEATNTPVYTETHNVNTNLIGLVNVNVGTGTTTDDFGNINWSKGSHFLKVSVDGTEFGTSQLLSVPYSLYANEAGNAFSGDYNDLSNKPNFSETDPVYSGSPASNITDAGSGSVITTAEREKLDSSIIVSGAVQEGNLLTYDGNNWIAKDLILSTNNSGANASINIEQPFLGMNYIIAMEGTFPSRNSVTPFIGEIIMFAGNFAPRGWQLCNGQLLPINQHVALFSIIGIEYGGDGRTTFALPDLRGRVPLGTGTGSGLNPRSLGQKGGAQNIILVPNQMPTHNHTITVKGN